MKEGFNNQPDRQRGQSRVSQTVHLDVCERQYPETGTVAGGSFSARSDCRTVFVKVNFLQQAMIRSNKYFYISTFL